MQSWMRYSGTHGWVRRAKFLQFCLSTTEWVMRECLRAERTHVMDTAGWLNLCYEALHIPTSLPDQDRRRLAERCLLETTNQPIDILGIGAAEAALDLVVRYGEAGRLDEVMLSWEQAEHLTPEIRTLGDEGTRRATICAKKLLQDVVAWTENEATGPH